MSAENPLQIVFERESGAPGKSMHTVRMTGGDPHLTCTPDGDTLCNEIDPIRSGGASPRPRPSIWSKLSNGEPWRITNSWEGRHRKHQ